LPSHVAVYDVNGPLFFGAAEKALSVLQRVNSSVTVVILDMRDVPMIDMTGIVALDSLVENLQQQHVAVVIANLQPRMEQKLSRAGILPEEGALVFCRDMEQARVAAMRLGEAKPD
jgi:SulP family sulfate permease